MSKARIKLSASAIAWVKSRIKEEGTRKTMGTFSFWEFIADYLLGVSDLILEIKIPTLSPTTRQGWGIRCD
jgi:hypothetical protein